MTTTSAEVERIAAGLTKAQREAVRSAHLLYGVYGSQPFRNRLSLCGICNSDYRAGRGFSDLTRLGEAVRQHLQGGSDGQ